MSEPKADATGANEGLDPLAMRSVVYRFEDEADFRRRVYRAVKALELHELDEWLKVEGKHVNDPHPELRRG